MDSSISLLACVLYGWDGGIRNYYLLSQDSLDVSFLRSVNQLLKSTDQITENAVVLNR